MDFLSKPDALSNIYNIVFFFCISSLITYAITEIAKPLLKSKIKDASLKTFYVRLIACISGGASGYTLVPNSLGFWIGFSSGAINSFVVAIIKHKVEDYVDLDDDKDDDKDDDCDKCNKNQRE